MARNLISSLLSLGASLLPSITASVQTQATSSSNDIDKERCVFEEELERMMQTLEQIKATLYDAEDREIRDRSVKLWLKELKRIAHAAEDVLGEYRYEAIRVQVKARKASEASGSHKRKQMECIVPIPDGMIDRLTKIRNQFDEIVKDRENLQLRESDGPRHPNYRNLRPPTGHMVDEMSIFGRDSEIEKIISFLLSDKENPFTVISIIGKGGLGKTTIAQIVYKDHRVAQCFNSFGWVCVSEEFEVSKLFKAIIESVSKTNCDVSELSPLQEKLANIVNGKRVLVVLDDVWNENQGLWELFQIPLKKARLVRILVTTRNDKVAEVMQAIAYFRPRYLSENYFWKLFEHYAFGNTSSVVSSNFIEMGRKIMYKCGGLPLAVKSIASLLRHEADEESWKEILECDLWESNPSNDIFPALQISYAHLPAYLKPCFLFCSMYPKDHMLEKITLIEFWISHGYIEPKGKRTIREIGTEYYEELKGRSFLDESSYGIAECKLHDIVHDLARLNSDNEHYSMNIDQPLDIYTGNILRETYHLHVTCHEGYANQIPQQNLKVLRTLVMDLRFKYQYCLKFEALRVLELEGYHLTEISDSIALLKHLSYLRIKSQDLSMLPSSIGLLFNLRTFILECYNSPLKYLPDSIGDLANLHYLLIRCDNLRKLPETIDHLNSLEELYIPSGEFLELPGTLGNCSKLKILKIGVCTINYIPQVPENFSLIRTMAACLNVRSISWLKDMKDLEGDLVIEGLENTSNMVDVQLANLRSMCHIRTLNLHWHNYHININHTGCCENKLRIRFIREPHEGKIVDDAKNFCLLEYLQPHPHLKILVLEGYTCGTVPQWIGNAASMQAIQEIRLLECWCLQSLPFCNLHTLKHLEISRCSGIRFLQLNQLPTQLEGLKISECNLESITGLRDLRMLTSLRITHCYVLKSITMDELQPHLAESAESAEPFGNSCHERPLEDRLNAASLAELEIGWCRLLCALPSELIQSEPSKMWVHHCGCPDLGNPSAFRQDFWQRSRRNRS